VLTCRARQTPMRDMTTTLHPTRDAPENALELKPAPVPPQPRGAPLWVAVALLGAVFIGGVILAFEPGQNFLDSWGFTTFSPLLQSRFFRAIADLGLLPVTTTVAVIAGVVSWRRDRRRTFACLGGPALAVELAELIKILVGRRFEGALCWPSGSTAAVAAMATAIVLVTRGAARWTAILVGSAAVILEIIALVAFRSHYLTDTFGGMFVGVGSVVLVDAVVHRLRLPDRRLFRSARAEPL
jgi:membrane-associated phospholipid phosphatase